ncbi:FAD-dependent oxidoreductase [Curtobacterium sp. Leaf261]|uniref:FAD-dependent oxidoreductase n=1 Tax=Curtobacterium sp. Leaf261 TaxID=1736311 RepID=UPI0006F2FC8D|nr:FAD-dependent oxidoreductase [Curtobacterium sp. Leaf261]KQO61180.1 hypothetical protein ASF23_11800 [Curtobacterium sp. Leaf261]
MTTDSTTTHTSVCIAGGGPAGMILGLLLARAGIRTTVLEKHDDFLRDFRGDTIHPTTLDLLADLGVMDALEQIPHSAVTTLDAVVNGVRFRAADFTRVARSGQLWFMPQWDLLDTIASAAQELPSFTLMMGTTAHEVVRSGNRVTGVRADGPDGPVTVSADLTIAADGRNSTLRGSAGLGLHESGAPIDVLWFRVDRPAATPPDTIAYLASDTIITIPRTDYYQCALLIPKGEMTTVRDEGLDAFRARVASAVPFLRPTIDSVGAWEDVKLLDVRIAHARRWHRPGFLLIGDAAHPMSPAFGVGINYAIQDAVAAARVLVGAGVGIRADLGSLDEAVLRRIQRRRALPARLMQQIQRIVHHTVGRPQRGRRLPPKALLRIGTPVVSVLVRHVAGRLVGAGFRPERLDRPRQ